MSTNWHRCRICGIMWSHEMDRPCDCISLAADTKQPAMYQEIDRLKAEIEIERLRAGWDEALRLLSSSRQRRRSAELAETDRKNQALCHEKAVLSQSHDEVFRQLNKERLVSRDMRRVNRGLEETLKQQLADATAALKQADSQLTEQAKLSADTEGKLSLMTMGYETKKAENVQLKIELERCKSARMSPNYGMGSNIESELAEAQAMNAHPIEQLKDMSGYPPRLHAAEQAIAEMRGERACQCETLVMAESQLIEAQVQADSAREALKEAMGKLRQVCVILGGPESEESAIDLGG